MGNIQVRCRHRSHLVYRVSSLRKNNLYYYIKIKPIYFYRLISLAGLPILYYAVYFFMELIIFSCDLL